MKKTIILLSLVAIFVLTYVTVQILHFAKRELRIVFCNVGQGDAIYIRTPNGSDIVIDGGPDEKMLHCLSDHMPFWDRKIEIVMLSHPHADHLQGLIPLIKRFDVDHFITEDLTHDSFVYKHLLEELKKKAIPIEKAFTGTQIETTDGVVLKALGPTKEYIQETSPEGTIRESEEFASLITELSFGNFKALFTGDSQEKGLINAFKSYSSIHYDIFQVPHHGSKTGISETFLKSVFIQYAIISVGKNSYKHPHPITLSLLQKNHIPILRTDTIGDIVITTDGKAVSIQK